MRRVSFLALALASAAVCAHAEIFRCAAGGAVTYQEVPCPASAASRTMDIPASFPEVNRAERERLLQREAALEARLLKRAEIEAMERIARDDRAAREREAEALREAAVAQQQQAAAMPAWPVFIVSRPLHPHHAPRVLRRGPPQRL